MAPAPQPEPSGDPGIPGSSGAGSRLILASGSPQRRDILTRLGLEFEIIVPDVAEVSGGDPETDVLENARLKAAAVDRRLRTPAGGQDLRPVVIACDTDVVDRDRILGKPATETEARRYLQRLSGREHEVISAVVIRGLPAAPTAVGDQSYVIGSKDRPRVVGGEEPVREGVARSRVRFRQLSEADIDWYLGTGEWRDRAGGYAIQGFGSALIAGVEGDLSNVIGLPVPVLVSLAPEIFS